MADEENKPKPTLEEIEEQHAKRREAREAAEREQYALDLQAKMDLEDEHGRVGSVKVAHVQGQPTRAFVRAPSAAEYKRYSSVVARASSSKNTDDIKKALEQLARSCWVYPRTDEERTSMLAQYPGLTTTIGVLAAKLGEGAADDEGKG